MPSVAKSAVLAGASDFKVRLSLSQLSTARTPSALEADALAKAALLSGREGAHHFLAEHGGLIVRDDGDVERIGPLHDRPRVRISLPP